MTEPETVEAAGQGFVEQSVEVDGFRIRYLESGSGEPIVWVHGAGGLQSSFALDDLASDHRVLMVELPGFGDSEINERTESAGEMAATLAEFIGAVDVAPVHLWGTSMGGIVATHLALDHPKLVKSLVLEGPGPFRSGAVNPATRSPEEMVAAFNNHPERVAWRETSPPDPARWPLVMKLMGAAVHDDALEARLAELQAPTLAFWGIDDGIIPPEGGQVYKARTPHCAYVLVYDAAHDVQGDRPEAVASMVRDFLKRGTSFVVSDSDARINP